MRTLRGSGPAPAGFYRCFDLNCSARRSPGSGRFEKLGTHYHPVRVGRRGAEESEDRRAAREGDQDRRDSYADRNP